MSYFVNERYYKTLQEVIPGVIKKVSAYDMSGNKIAAWGASLQNNIHTEFMPSDAPIGAIYPDIANYDDYTLTEAKDNKKIVNCINCGAILKSHICEYCGTVYKISQNKRI